jgi:AbrB family looped-hinge helix DNA binding protein
MYYTIMSRLIETTKTQDRGIVTIPESVREKLGIKKGTTVLFIENEKGNIEIRTLEAEAIDMLDDIGAALREKGITLDRWLATGRKNRKRLFENAYPNLA